MIMEKVQIDDIVMERIKEIRGTFSNATWKYLTPCMRVYGSDFTYWISSVYKTGVGVGDIIVNRCGLRFEKHLFFLIDTQRCVEHFRGFISWIKDKPMYEDDYVYGNIQSSRLHMVVIKFPEQFYSVLEPFKLGQYSKMYTPEQIDELFQGFNGTTKILRKDHNYRIKFVNQLNKDWGTTILASEWDGELDLPPDDNKNLFNNHLK